MLPILRIRDKDGNVVPVPAIKGDSGVYVGSGEVPEGYNVQIDPDAVATSGWEKLGEFTFAEDGTPMSMSFTNLGGMTEFLFKVEGLTNGSTNSGMNVSINGYGIKSQPIPVTKAAANYCYVEVKFNGLYWKYVRTGASSAATNYTAGTLQTPYNVEIVDGLAPANTLSISQHSTYYAKAGKLIIYGKRPQASAVLKVYDDEGNAIAIQSIQGASGSSPVKGEDYWTPDDQQAIVNAVIANFTDVSEVGL